jgi:pyridoxamine 5'-phosphate oxidase
VTTAPADAPGEDPLSVFDRWHHEAAGAVDDADAMVLATASREGRPSARYVLLRGITHEGVRFYTNYESRKGTELAANPHAAAVWFDGAHRRQVRLEGSILQLDPAVSDAYFASRDRGHQLGAVASSQSHVLRDRAELEDAYAGASARFEGHEVLRPAHWGGYLLAASMVELWIQRQDRLHDRFVYTRASDGWDVVRLAP